jgi:FkbM family methyltransferase
MQTVIKNVKPAVVQGAKWVVERIGGCRVYRSTLPHGVDCFVDIEKRFGRQGIKVIFDVGANIGQSAVEYLQQFPQAEIYCFEPVAATYRELVTVTHRFSRIHAFNFGMGQETCETVIHVCPESTYSSIRVGMSGDHPESIKLETIAEFAKKQDLETIDFLKVDTEGYDLEVLSGAAPLLQQQKVHFIFAECQPAAHSERFVGLSALEEFLEGFGYRLFGIYDQSFPRDGANSLCFCNALFVCGKLIPQGAKLP